mmetsp:Transcript_4496/g.9672  ORF Transcript_4496/g.9672 Transcript_4496/m.9672 type:complete len:723 (-) Transcript_4496:189-2357(-)|eukprot:CAMPEP_0202922844 /NCGR_PEP_ID=MMETSP1392-20130828/78135_1 /ASSEMBLY_ACC=CAM_ASM_000868 /TAXON_ID=225041 /ORGANISM="Chlamydomonas chlamydogama, Strain SAG 11-48b" /LENGTH=722 /DNA_ID=CAMNT_0049616497 /DNA_START=40 /DNA_END=2208 /DNA_ORIENTATION=-
MKQSANKSGNNNAGRKAVKRKLADTFDSVEPAKAQPEVPGPPEIRALVEVLKNGVTNGSIAYDKSPLRKAAHQLAELCKQDEYVDMVVNEGAVEAVVPLLNSLEDKPWETDSTLSAAQEELEKEACFILGLLAVKPEYQTRIAQCGALQGLVRLLKEHRIGIMTKSQPGSGGAARRAADAITNLAHENVDIKNMVRDQGGIPPLVALLEALDLKVQRAAAGALRTLAFKNEENKNQIVECGALPILIQMLRSEDVGVHYEAVGVIGNLVHSSQNIKRKVLEEGALQPVINLLKSTCPESQREAALLLGQFATTPTAPTDTTDFKARIAQRGAVAPLIQMLSNDDTSLKEMAAFALGRLAQNSDNQAGIVQAGGLVPLLELLESKHYNLQHNAAFALYGLADNEDNIPDIIKEGVLQRLIDCGEKLQVQASKDCVQKTIGRMEQKLNGRVLSHVVFMLRSSDKSVQQRAAIALAHLVPETEARNVFVEKRGLDVLLDMLVDSSLAQHMQLVAANALLALAKKINATSSNEDCVPAQPAKTVYLGAQYVNNATLADVSFVVEGRKFHAHRIALLASSDAFRAMFNGGYREKEASSIEIPNIPWEVFEAMMYYIYTGHVEVKPDIASELLQASDQYLLEGLKRLCEITIAQGLSIDTVLHTFTLSEAFTAPQLAKRCVLFALEHFEQFTEHIGPDVYMDVMQRMVPQLRVSLLEDFVKSAAVSKE